MLNALHITLSTFTASLSSASTAITTDHTLGSKSSGGVGHGAISSQRMSLGVVVAMRQLQTASKVLTNMILFKGKDSVTYLPFPSLSFLLVSVKLLILPFPSYSYLPLSVSFAPFPLLFVLILVLILSFFLCRHIDPVRSL